MAESSAISWTRSTFNPWIGCTKVGPGCDACYAEALDRQRFSKTLGGASSSAPIIHWGPGAPRYRTSVHNWNEPLRWQRKAALEASSGVLTPGSDWAGAVGHWPVFCSSLADVFDNEVDPAWRSDLWSVVLATPALSWLLVTKRVGNVRGMVPPAWLAAGFPANVRVLITVVNQEEADRDVPKLLALPCKNGISYEPALGPVRWRPDWLHSAGIGWIIVGGESSQGGAKARPFNIAWARSTVVQCKGAGVPVFVKQLGSNPMDTTRNAGLAPGVASAESNVRWQLEDKAGGNMAEWPEDLRIQQFPV